MENYDKQINALRYCCAEGSTCEKCWYYDKMTGKNYPHGFDTIHCMERRISNAADTIEKLSTPIPVICKDGCTYCHEDFGDRYTPPSFECVKAVILETFNIEACYSEHDIEIPSEVPVCPFYMNRATLEQLFWEYHIGEKLVLDYEI